MNCVYIAIATTDGNTPPFESSDNSQLAPQWLPLVPNCSATHLVTIQGVSDFATRAVGATTYSPFFVTNNGTGRLNFGSIQISDGSAVPGFSIQSTTCQGSLAAHQSCAVTVSFNPTAAGDYVGTLSIPILELPPQKIGLAGHAVAATSGSNFTYRYQGNPFSTIVNLSGAVAITATLGTSAALPVNSRILLSDPLVTSFEISDGGRVIANGNGSLLPSSYVATDAQGNIWDWQIAELDGLGRTFALVFYCCTLGDEPMMYTYSNNQDASYVGDLGYGGTQGGYGYENGARGSWSRL